MVYNVLCTFLALQLERPTAEEAFDKVLLYLRMESIREVPQSMSQSTFFVLWLEIHCAVIHLASRCEVCAKVACSWEAIIAG